MTLSLVPPDFHRHRDIEPYFTHSSNLSQRITSAIDLSLFERLLWLAYRHQPRAIQITRNSESISDAERKNIDIVKSLPSLLSRGFSIVLNYAEEFDPDLANISRDLTIEVGCPAHFAIFLSSIQAPAFKPHRDAVDIAAVQIVGRKRWDLEGGEQSLLKDPIIFEESSSFSPDRQVTLDPGDLLYIPRGLPHAVRTCDSPLSLHVSVAINATTKSDVLKTVVDDREARIPSLRKSAALQVDFNTSELYAPSKREIQRATQWIRAKEFQRLPQLPGYIAARMIEEDIKAEDSFVVLPGMPVQVLLDGGEGVARIFFPGLKPPKSTIKDSGLVFSAHFIGILEFIASRRTPFRISDFQHSVPDNVALHIVKTLMNEGLLVKSGME